MEQVQDRSLQGLETLDKYQDRFGRICDVEQVPGSFQGGINDVARVCYVDRVPDLLPGSDWLRYTHVAGACFITKNVRFAI